MKRYVLTGSVAVFAVAVMGATANASDQFRVTITGSVTDVYEPACQPGIQLGAPFIFSCEFAASAPDQVPQNPDHAEYDPKSVSIQVGSFAPAWTPNIIRVWNDWAGPPGPQDAIAFHYPWTVAAPGNCVGPTDAYIVFGDSDGTTWSTMPTLLQAVLDSPNFPNSSMSIEGSPSLFPWVVSADVTTVVVEKLAAGACSPDSDQPSGDGIQDNVDPFPNTPSNTALDTSTTPDTRVGLINRGNQVLCASDAPAPKGIRVKSLSGGSLAAKPTLTCIAGKIITKFGNVTAGKCITLTCLTGASGPVANIVNSCGTTTASVASFGGAPGEVAAVGDVDVELLRSGIVIATLVLPEGNAITYDPQTAEVTAPASNNTTLNLVGRSGEQQPLAPGETTIVLDSAIPTASVWGLVALTLALLVGAKVYFSRRRATAA